MKPPAASSKEEAEQLTRTATMAIETPSPALRVEQDPPSRKTSAIWNWCEHLTPEVAVEWIENGITRIDEAGVFDLMNAGRESPPTLSVTLIQDGPLDGENLRLATLQALRTYPVRPLVRNSRVAPDYWLTVRADCDFVRNGQSGRMMSETWIEIVERDTEVVVWVDGYDKMTVGHRQKWPALPEGMGSEYDTRVP